MGEEEEDAERTEASPALAALTSRASFLIGAIANRLVNSNSALGRTHLGIGFTEWRIIVMLALQPGVTAKGISDVVGIDKAAISRGLKSLEAAGLARATPETAGRRSRDYLLTEAGWAVQKRLAAIGAEQEQRLLSRLEPGESPVLLDMLRRLLTAADEL